MLPEVICSSNILLYVCESCTESEMILSMSSSLANIVFFCDMILVPSRSKGLPLIEETFEWIQNEARLKT